MSKPRNRYWNSRIPESGNPFAWLDVPQGLSVRETKRELSTLESDVTHTAPSIHDRYSLAEWNLFFTVRSPATAVPPDTWETWPADRHVLLYDGQEQPL